MTPPPLHALIVGDSGPPILLLHGWQHSLQTLRPLGELLGMEQTVHLIDLPGFGLSQLPGDNWGTKEYAQAILDYLNANGLKQVDLLGHSFGGRIGIYLASNHPDRIRSLILVSSAGLIRHRSGKQLIRARAIGVLRSILKFSDAVFRTTYFQNWFIPKFGSVDYRNASGPLRKVLVRTVNEDLSAAAGQIRCPTLLVWGENDTETPLEMALRLQSFIKNSSLVRLPGVGHNPFAQAGSHLVAYHVRPFLRKL